MEHPADQPDDCRRLESLQALVGLTEALKRAQNPDEVYSAALGSLSRSLGIRRASILLFDGDGVLRFRAWRGLSESYRRAVEGHSPWPAGEQEAERVLVPDADAAADPSLGPFRDVLREEGIGALAFIPLHFRDRLLGTLTLYHDLPHEFAEQELGLASAIGSHVAFAIDRHRAESERQMLLDRAQEAEARYRALFAGFADAVFVADADGRYLDVNTAAEVLLGYRREELLRMNVADVTDWPAERTREEYESFRQAPEWRQELSLRRKDGSLVPIEVRANAVAVPGGVVYISVARDVTERQRAEAALKRSEARFRRLFESNTIGIAFWTFDGRIVEANDAFLQIVGYDRHDLVAGRVSWRAMTPEEYRDLDDTAIRQLEQSGVCTSFEKEFVRRDGRRVPVLIGAARLDAEGSEAVKFAIDLTERRRSAVEIQRLYEEAKRANLAKDEFLATASHELRTPLNAILGWTTLLRGGQVEPAAVGRALATIERNARTQAHLIEEILDVSRIITGKLRLECVQVDLGSVVEAAMESVRPAAEARSITLGSSLRPRSLSVLGDAMRLQQVVWNLLSNAIKFTPEGGQVTVEMESGADCALLRVRDSGLGISREFLPHVFERFRQADSSTTRQHGGLGLGLAIVRHLVELHGGFVEAESAGLGKGSIFSIVLPLAHVAGPELPSAREAESRGRRPAPSLAGLAVLVVEDEDDSRELTATTLELAGARVTSVASCGEALELLRGPSAPSFEVIVSDIAMPGADGFELIRQVRALPAPRGLVPVLALTAYAGAENRARLLEAGFQGHLEKPAVPSELARQVARLAGR